MESLSLEVRNRVGGDQKRGIFSHDGNQTPTRRLARTISDAKDAVERMATPAQEQAEVLQRKIFEIQAELISIQETIKLITENELAGARCKEQELLIELNKIRQQDLVRRRNEENSEIKVEVLSESQRETVMAIARLNFTASDMEALGVQLNEYFETPAHLRTVDKRIMVRNRVMRQELYLFYKYGEPAGFSGLEYSINNGDTSTVLINWTGVHPRYKRNGVGSEMIRFVEERAKTIGCFRRIGVKTCDEYVPAIALYEKLGFVQRGHSLDYFGEGNTLLEYHKPI